MTPEQLKTAIDKHAKYLRGEAGGEFASFVRANLRGANLYGANLYGANLRGANLYGANLYGANLGGADLRGADLYGANLRGANLGGADLGGANLGGADLRGADLRGANLYGANLYGANLGGSTYLGCLLRLVGACGEAVAWVDEQEHGDLVALWKAAKPEWRKWLTSALGGEPTPERLLFVAEYVVEGVA